MIVLYILLVLIIVTKIYYKYTTIWCKSQTCLKGKTTIVTGSNTGIGYEVALDFAKRGARVILACRNRGRAEDARARIIEETGNENVVVKLVDLGSLKSVRSFAREIKETESRLDILVNNAGIADLGGERSEDSNILILQVNYFSSFLLTNLLIDLMKKTKGSRIINVTSLLAILSRNFDLDKLHIYPGDWQAYPYSKLCQVLFTIELGRRLKGTGISTYAVHPGGVKTTIYKNLHGTIAVMFYTLRNLFFITVEEAAQSVIYCAVAKGIEEHTGEIFTNCSKTKRYKVASNPEHPAKLWKVSEQAVQLTPEESSL